MFPGCCRTVYVESGIFGLGHRAADCGDARTNTVESAIGAVVVGIAAVVPSTGDGYRTRTRLIGCIGVDFENHITGSVTGDMFGMGGEVVEEAPSGSNSVLGGVGLCGRDVVASRKDEWVLDASIIEKVTVHLLDPEFLTVRCWWRIIRGLILDGLIELWRDIEGRGRGTFEDDTGGKTGKAFLYVVRHFSVKRVGDVIPG